MKPSRRKDARGREQEVSSDKLRKSPGVDGARSNGVGRLAGTWSHAEHEEFVSAVQKFERIDWDLWK